jgi:uncharacterized protein YbaR (Trm112 family)
LPGTIWFTKPIARDPRDTPQATRDEGGPVAVQLDPQLMDILACPAEDHGPLRAEADADVLVCTVCGRRYPVEDGIPVLLLDRAIP